jgi:bidirectional [NiFe] hydrogenase diaphorase subunit
MSLTSQVALNAAFAPIRAGSRQLKWNETMTVPMEETKDIVFTLDGREAKAERDETVLSVAKRLGVTIPALCHHQAVTSYGACRLCVVEVRKGNRTRMVTSCIYLPDAGDVVETDNERVRQLRRMVLELLLARCPEVPLIVDLARQYGIEGSSRFRVSGHAGANERCIVCGLCVRVCAEVIGQHAIGYVHRGGKRMIAAPFETQAEECIGCGACAFVCPTQAIHLQDIDGKRVINELTTSLPMMKCTGCGKAFATEKQIERLRRGLPTAHDKITMCPSCRREAFRDAAGKALI